MAHEGVTSRARAGAPMPAGALRGPECDVVATPESSTSGRICPNWRSGGGRRRYRSQGHAAIGTGAASDGSGASSRAATSTTDVQPTGTRRVDAGSVLDRRIAIPAHTPKATTQRPATVRKSARRTD